MSSKKILSLILLCLSLVIVIYSYGSTPTYIKIKKLTIGSDRYLMDANNQIIQQTRTSFERRRLAWLPLFLYSKTLTNTIVAIEDKRFYSHWGVDFIALGRAFLAYVNKSKIQGASTLTMQLVNLIDRNVLIKSKRIRKGGLLYKFNQIWQALYIDLKWSKEEILETYLNLIHLKGEFQSVQSFTNAYLDKSPSFLSPAESLIIASLIRSPNQKLKKLKAISCIHGKKVYNKFDCIKLDQVIAVIATSKAKIINPYNLAPHLLKKLMSLEFKDHTYIKSYIDQNLQLKVTHILEKNLSYLQKNNVTDASAIVIENKTGKILAYVGSISKFSKAKYVDGADSPRQAGSTLKPFLYAKAIDKKIITAASILPDNPTVLTWSGGVYRPVNYDHSFHGPVTVRQALASSLNIPAVKIVKMLGLKETYSTIQALNFSSLKNPDFYGASIALGAAEVKLHELANAYRAMANRGALTPLKWSKSYQSKTKVTQIMSPETSYIISSILSDPNARRMGFNWNSSLETGFWTAVKTGTSKGLRDNWCVGISENYTVAVWAGNFSAKKMYDVSGVSGAGPSWFEIMSYLHSKEKSEQPPPPSSLVKSKVIFDWSINPQTEYFIKGTEPHNNKVLLAPSKSIQIIFPANNSELSIDPHQTVGEQKIFIRYKGSAPKNSTLYFDNKKLGYAKNPFPINNLRRGTHRIKIVNPKGTTMDRVIFTVF